MTEPDTANYWRLRANALANRSLVFRRLIDVQADDPRFIALRLTKHAIEAGYCESRKAIKGATLLDWSRLTPPIKDGAGTPSRWACVAAIDLIYQGAGTPSLTDLVFLHCWLFYRLVALGNPVAVIAEFPVDQQHQVRECYGI